MGLRVPRNLVMRISQRLRDTAAAFDGHMRQLLLEAAARLDELEAERANAPYQQTRVNSSALRQQDW